MSPSQASAQFSQHLHLRWVIFISVLLFPSFYNIYVFFIVFICTFFTFFILFFIFHNSLHHNKIGFRHQTHGTGSPRLKASQQGKTGLNCPEIGAACTHHAASAQSMPPSPGPQAECRSACRQPSPGTPGSGLRHNSWPPSSNG